MLEVEGIMFDPRVSWPRAEIRKLTALVKMCTNKSSKLRPSMDKVAFFTFLLHVQGCLFQIRNAIEVEENEDVSIMFDPQVITSVGTQSYMAPETGQTPKTYDSREKAPIKFSNEIGYKGEKADGDHNDSDSDDDDDDDDDSDNNDITVSKSVCGKEDPKSNQSLGGSSSEQCHLRSSFLSPSRPENRLIVLSTFPQTPTDLPRELVELPFEQLKKGTNEFNSSPVTENGRFLGSGSFGNVYLGYVQLADTDMPSSVAVKKLKPVIDKVMNMALFIESLSSFL